MRIAPSLCVDGEPVPTNKLFILSKINDLFWECTQNCVLRKGGLIVAQRDIRPREQLCMAYGPDGAIFS